MVRRVAARVYAACQGLTQRTTGTVWPQLRVLNLDGNAITTWSEIGCLVRCSGLPSICERSQTVALLLQAHQPVLEQLHLSGNQLTRVEPPPDAAAFPLLRTLLLAGNQISDWCEHSEGLAGVGSDLTRYASRAGHLSTRLTASRR
jgi:Leucine-rich repeat (LRR) protein